RVLIDHGIAAGDDTAPAPQDGTAPGLCSTRQPCPGAVGHGLGAGGGNAIGRAVQNDRVTRSTTLRQKHEGIEPDAVAHRYHGLEAACAAGVLSVHRLPSSCCPYTGSVSRNVVRCIKRVSVSIL